ncbi:hypothetical protein A2662_00990 [Candidatus Giovannonibacteria bacterium RIFCSPHIGHO2_01_FULL_45_33]|nr:MAG: hypothetical protein A2662_00990 [Candidatus Giovannonibacteria bacterium RIFCSPHIGHO2_01_FULL_45_33]OGF69577.1 MAG: hypothetical protein A3C73_00675 [Candidatus Giovannonibacteria bacterium RIFCSPHIGHO2_02_FULL_44_11]
MMPYMNFPVNFPVPAPIEINIAGIPNVPFYSQFRDIQSLKWQKVGCGIADLAMLIEFYNPGSVSVNTLLGEAIAEGAYQQGAGWKHKALALLSEKYGLEGENYDLSGSDKNTAFAKLKNFLTDGPVIASVHYKFDPKSPIPHLVVINGIDGDTIYYNDPAEHTAGKKISVAGFLKGWKKRFIVVRPLYHFSSLNLTILPVVSGPTFSP